MQLVCARMLARHGALLEETADEVRKSSTPEK